MGGKIDDSAEQATRLEKRWPDDEHKAVMAVPGLDPGINTGHLG